MIRYLLIDPSLEQAVRMEGFRVIEIRVESITLHQIAEELRKREIPFKAL